ncbi:Rha family transcriptional regulator [Paenibacillus macerans]|uniref:Rha family transcriptional regulator n=1 Tax=Paenibacillus macerans TaxID=44252 RepID=UPI00203F43C2|nr:Rha family transcriptional regulator [Paenibacillus macerans]MCM3701866.1 Rha family transcriptional regulator [Paenibacillus macerans]
MNQLVFIENGRVVTDTLIVSEMFGKTHDNVMRDTRNQIEKLNEAGEFEFSLLNFEESSYTNDRGRVYPKIDMTEEGFVLVAMSYVTPEAMKMKVKFIQEFKRMREQLRSVPVLDSNTAIAIALRQTADVMEKLPVIESKLETLDHKVETQITLDSGQQRRLQQAINKKVCAVETDKSERSELFRQLYREIKDRWQVPSYKDILRQDLQDVLNYVEAWKPIRKTA